jgi:hypothetical protein
MVSVGTCLPILPAGRQVRHTRVFEVEFEVNIHRTLQTWNLELVLGLQM